MIDDEERGENDVTESKRGEEAVLIGLYYFPIINHCIKPLVHLI